MDLSYQEKSILGSAAAIAIAYSYYFAVTLRDIGQPNFTSRSVERLIFIVVAIVVIEIVYHIVIALESKPEPKDERDVLIECKAYRTAYFSVFSGMSLVVTWLIMLSLAGTVVAPFLVVNAILLVLVVTELLQFLTQLFYYRRGLR